MTHGLYQARQVTYRGFLAAGRAAAHHEALEQARTFDGREEQGEVPTAGKRFEAAAAFVQAYPHDLPVLHALLPDVQTPVFVVAGSDDPIVPPPNGELLAKLLPHCRNELIKGGHLVWEDAPAAYAARLATWFGGEYRTI